MAANIYTYIYKEVLSERKLTGKQIQSTLLLKVCQRRIHAYNANMYKFTLLIYPQSQT